MVVFFVSLQPTECEVALLSVSNEHKSWKLKGHIQFQLPRGESNPNTDILSQVERQIPGHLDKSQHGSSQGKDFIRPPYTGQSTVGSSVESIVPTGLSSRACEHPRNGVSTRLFMTIYLRKQKQRYSTHLNSVRGHHYPHLQM